MPQTLNADVAVIGAGSAGMTAYGAAIKHTPKVLLIEGGPYGTTCARVGCMPSKLLIAAAHAAHEVAHAALFGVHAGPVRVDGRAVMARVRSERDRFVGFTVEAVEAWPAAQRLRGQARFVNPNTLDVNGTQVRADRIVIATGSRPWFPEAWRALGDRLIVNDDVFDWQELPRSVAVVGAGPIGLELAQALHRLGVRVRLYARSTLPGPLTALALQAAAREIFAAELPLASPFSALQVTPDGDGVRVLSTHAEAVQMDDHFDYLLAATGRRPNVDTLGLQASGLPLGPDGVPPFDPGTGQVGDSHVFIAGDAASYRPLLHEAADEGRIAGDNAGRFPDVRMHARRAPLTVVFTDPQMMIAGAGRGTLEAAGTRFAVGSVSFEDQGRSRVMGVNRGLLEVYGCPLSGRFLGAEMVGPAAEHIGHLLAWSVQRGDTVQQMLDCPFYHPVVEEGVRTALRNLLRALHMGPVPVPRCQDCGPGA